MIIGLTGLLGAGKGSVAKYLKTKGYKYYSLSDEIREEADKRGIEKNLQNLIDLGNKLRKEFSSGVLAQRINKKIEKNRNQDYIIDSIRNPEEIRELKKNPNFFLIAVTAPIEERYKRIQARKREDDEKISFKQFKEAEEGQLEGEGTGQQLLKCIDQSDFQIVNDQTIEQLGQKVEEILKKAK